MLADLMHSERVGECQRKRERVSRERERVYVCVLVCVFACARQEQERMMMLQHLIAECGLTRMCSLTMQEQQCRSKSR